MSMSYNKRGKYSYGYGKNFHSHRRKNRYKSSSNVGCFIATVVYGTPLSEEIDIIRSWRDEKLEKTNYGRFFIHIYYKISPSIAKYISQSNLKKYFIRILLKPVICYFKNK